MGLGWSGHVEWGGSCKDWGGGKGRLDGRFVCVGNCVCSKKTWCVCVLCVGGKDRLFVFKLCLDSAKKSAHTGLLSNTINSPFSPSNWQPVPPDALTNAHAQVQQTRAHTHRHTQAYSFLPSNWQPSLLDPHTSARARGLHSAASNCL